VLKHPGEVVFKIPEDLPPEEEVCVWNSELTPIRRVLSPKKPAEDPQKNLEASPGTKVGE